MVDTGLAWPMITIIVAAKDNLKVTPLHVFGFIGNYKDVDGKEKRSDVTLRPDYFSKEFPICK